MRLFSLLFLTKKTVSYENKTTLINISTKYYIWIFTIRHCFYEIRRNDPFNTNNLNLGLNFRSHFSYNDVSVGPDLTANYRYKEYSKVEIYFLETFADKKTGESWNGQFETASDNKRHNEIYAGTTVYFLKQNDEHNY